MMHLTLPIALCIHVDASGVGWMRAKEIAEFLGYGNETKSTRAHVSAENKKYWRDLQSDHADSHPRVCRRMWQPKKTIFINESGLYEMIISSRLPHANEFKPPVNGVIPPNDANGIRKILREYMPKETDDNNN